MIFLVIFIAVFFVGIFIMLIYKSGQSAVALSKPSIECPVCGRSIHVVGNATKCYKCKSKLIKHANGNYIKG